MTVKKKTIGVFCGTNEAMPPLYKEEAFALGKGLAEKGYHLVTGGGNTGLMGAVVNGFSSVSKRTGRGVQGIVPAIFKRYQAYHEKIPLENLVWTETLHQRLQAFSERCDIFVILEGGFGTLHELLDFLVPKQWGLHQKKMILVNRDGFWDPLLSQFERMVGRGALKQRHLELFTVVKSGAECLEELVKEEAAPPYRGLEERYWE